MSDPFIERSIIIGIITQTEVIKAIRDIYTPAFIESPEGRTIVKWCLEYYDQYNEAPKNHIEQIYFEKTTRLEKALAENIESILRSMSNDTQELNLVYLIDQTKQYFIERQLIIHNDKIKTLISNGRIDQAIELINEFTPLFTNQERTDVDLSSNEVLPVIDQAFQEADIPLIHFAKQLGTFWNSQFIRGGFIAFLAREKLGKTWMLMYIANLAVTQDCNVAFFQAGDMSENQQIRRFCIHLAKKSDKEKYCKEHFQPVRDCVLNQRDDCDRKERECSFGIFESFTNEQIRNEITFDQLQDAYNENPTYKPCFNCQLYKQQKIGCVWLEKVLEVTPLDAVEAKQQFTEKYIKTKNRLMLSSHANGTLSVSKIKSILNNWKRVHNFVPDIIIIDYADLLVPSSKQEFRHQQNEIWKELRKLSQEKINDVQPLLITVTQADADAYNQNILKLKNFSEDKRKYGHATGFYGLNQDYKGREKRLGILRINELLLREDDFEVTNICYVLQNLKRGQPYLASYF